jgi:hypothetical protein
VIVLILAEIFLPISDKQPDCHLELPEGTRILKFGAQVETGKIQAPGPKGGTTTVQLKPLILCLLNPEAPVQPRRFLLRQIGEPIPDGATYVDGFQLPNGVVLHLLEIPRMAEIPQKKAHSVLL